MDVRSTAAASSRNVVACPVCGHDAQFAYTHPEARIFRCTGCTHAFSDPESLEGLEPYSADYYDEAHRNWFANPNLALFDWIEKRIPSDCQSLIDLGCGRGQFLDFVRARRPNIRLVGVDLSHNVNRDSIEFHCGDALDLKLGAFDAVVSLATIEHVSDVAGFARRIHDFCNPGGIVVVMTLDDGSLLYRASRLALWLGMPVGFNRLYSAHHLHHFTHRSLVRLLERSGLNLLGSLHHSVPLKALDLPVSPLVRPIFLAGVKTVFIAGDLIRLSYLQTIIAQRPSHRAIISSTKMPSAELTPVAL
jgi:2-polyprenyl-3-methyl-5-hydroxy-6-metoxy-1,4-benzoquinol methylase